MKLGAFSTYYSKSFANGDTLKVDGFLGRSLFDLYSNFTFFLNDPVHGDAFQQHDSRLQQGANVQYTHVHKLGSIAASVISGINFHDNEINVGLYPREGRVPTGVTTRANAHVTNEAGYAQETLSFWRGRLLVGGGLRFDEFRYNVQDRVSPGAGGLQYAGRWQGKGNVAFKPAPGVPLRFTSITVEASTASTRAALSSTSSNLGWLPPISIRLALPPISAALASARIFF